MEKQRPSPSSSSASLPTPSSTASRSASTTGHLHVKLIQARGLNVQSPVARPYIVVQFEQNEFVSRDSIESQGTSKSAIAIRSSDGSPAALSALRKVASSRVTRSPPIPSPTHTSQATGSNLEGRVSSSNSPTTKPFDHLSARDPVWKHMVSFDVTSDEGMIALNINDRSNDSEHGFLGTLQIKPILIHNHTVDEWYKLRPFDDEVVTGEIHIQTAYERLHDKRPLTPESFEIIKLIGRGGYGKVFQVRKKDTRRIYAMKVLSKKEIVANREVAYIIGERQILQHTIESPFLLGLKFSFQTPLKLYLVTDFKCGGELFWHLQRETSFSEERARFYTAELILALEYLHKYDIVYRDLKPENILLDATGHVALCDFGLSKSGLPADHLTKTLCGTTEYLAPEILLDDQGYSKLVDFWSLGVLLFEMVCGWSPFYAEDIQEMYKNICFGKIHFPQGVVSGDAKLFVKGLLNRNPKHRLGAINDAAELKEHVFFESIDWRALSLKQTTPPFRPDVESDESTANFDPEFTTADLGEDKIADESDSSEDWIVSKRSISVLEDQRHGLSSSHHRIGIGRHMSHAVEIEKKRHNYKAPWAESLLTHSVQEAFRGFTYSGDSSVLPSSLLEDVARMAEGQVESNGETEDVIYPGEEDGGEDDDHDGYSSC